MELAEPVPVTCNDESLLILEPITITVRSALLTGGSANYFVEVVARYEPDASNILHIWIAKDFMEKENDRIYFSYLPQLILHSTKQAIQQDSAICGGYLCFCHIMSNPIDNRDWAFESAVNGIIRIIRSDYTELSDKQIHGLFDRF